jgi:hypothetical protein
MTPPLHEYPLSHTVSSSTVTRELVADVLDKLVNAENGPAEEERLQVLSAFEVPRFQYNVHRKVYFPVKEDAVLHGEATDKMQVYISRMHLLLQRLRRHHLFSSPAFAGLVAGSKGADCEVSPPHGATPSAC